jgi:hypothetical protein
VATVMAANAGVQQSDPTFFDAQAAPSPVPGNPIHPGYARM